MQRTTLFLVAEGQTENGFLTRLLAEHLGLRGIDLHVPVIGAGPRKGGMKFRSFDDVCKEISRFLADRRTPWVTTFFDYYGLPTGAQGGWNFVNDEKIRRGVDGLEARLAEGVRSVAGEASARFCPYIQMHELEALFFAEPATLAEVLGDPAKEPTIAKIVASAAGCEAINDSPTTAPSKRIQTLFPSYIKGRSAAAHAPRLAHKLDLDVVRRACPRFHGWLTALEALSPALAPTCP
ncbi:MAG: DUF4276 family protein [Nannocystis sp.]|nr:DUF4276 family protein [Nannocystis sp.]